MTQPPSWASFSDYSGLIFYEALPDVDEDDLRAEDFFLDLHRANPTRSAYSHVTNLDLSNTGRWVILENGDRIWLMGLHSKGAESLGVILENLFLPEGAELFIYNEDRSSVYGPIAAKDNRPSAIQHIPPLPGDKIVLEYFEPYTVRGQGQFAVRRVAHAYRSTQPEAIDASEGFECLVDATCSASQTVLEAAQSVVLITTAEGSQSATGVLINNTGNIERPFVLTSDKVIEGRASSMLFTFNRVRTGCSDSPLKTEHVITGADIVAHDAGFGMVLLELHDAPQYDWGLFYSGWSRDVGTSEPHLALFHPATGPVKRCEVNGAWKWIETAAGNTVQVDAWESGALVRGALGAPLFNAEGQVIGIFVEGKGDCGEMEYDRFLPLAESWTLLSPYLDPGQTNSVAIGGDDVDIRPADPNILRANLALFPNPAKDRVFIFNGNPERLTEVNIYNYSGQRVEWVVPEDQEVQITGLAAGVYVVEMVLDAATVVREKLIVE